MWATLLSFLLVAVSLVPMYPKPAMATITAAAAFSGSTESDLRSGSTTITITLSANTWVSDVATDQDKADLLFNSMIADNDQTQWGNVVGSLETNWNSNPALSDIQRINDQTVTISVPALQQTDYNITADQQITVNIPPSLLGDSSNAVDVSPSFTVTADTQAVIPNPNLTQADIVQGGKTIDVSLVNDTWVSDIVYNTTHREQLFDSLIGSGADASKWTAVVTALKTTPDPTTVISLSGNTVTITLPKVPTFSISGDLTVNLDLTGITGLHSSNLVDMTAPSFTIKQAATTVTLGGSATSGLKEKDIVAGGKTLDITLNGNSWDPHVITDTVDRTKWNTLINSLQAGSDPNGAWSQVQTALKNVGQGMATLSTDEKTLTLTFPAVSEYSITSDQTINVNLAAAGTTLFQSAYPAKNTSQFIISEDRAPSVSVSSGIGWETTVRNGGGTITITLTNASWATDLSTNATKRNALIDGFKATSDTTAWNLVKAALKANPSDFSVVGNQVILTLPPVPNYDIVANQGIYVTVPKSVLNQGTADIVVSTAASPSFTIYLPTLYLKGTLDNALKSFNTYLSTYRLDEMMVVVPKKYLYSVTITNSDLGGTLVTTIDVVTDPGVYTVSGTVGATTRSSSVATFILPDGKKKFSLGFMGLNKDTDEVILSALDGGNYALQSSETVKISTKSKALAPKTDISGTYSLYALTTNSTLLKNITSMYKLQDLNFATTR